MQPPNAPSETSLDPQRLIWRIEGPEAVSFLQGLVTNDMLPLSHAPGLIWAALLNPQGKYLADFFVLRREGDPATCLHLDIDTRLAPAILRLLRLYRLRADVTISETDLYLGRGHGAAPKGAFADPRHPALGWRFYAPSGLKDAPGDMPLPDLPDEDAIRVAHLIPAFPDELRPNESYILEQGFERLHGVDFRKGCYVGQEVTARMKHKTDLRKGLVRLVVEQGGPEVGLPDGTGSGTAITLPDGREAGTLGTRSGDRALAFMRFDRLSAPLQAGSLRLRAEGPLPQS